MVAKETAGNKAHPHGNGNFFFDAGRWNLREKHVVPVLAACSNCFYQNAFPS
jgi:hypothetical protein